MLSQVVLGIPKRSDDFACDEGCCFEMFQPRSREKSTTTRETMVLKCQFRLRGKYLRETTVFVLLAHGQVVNKFSGCKDIIVNDKATRWALDGEA